MGHPEPASGLAALAKVRGGFRRKIGGGGEHNSVGVFNVCSKANMH